MRLLPPSETFIQKQAAALRRFTPFFVGRRRVPGIDIPLNCSLTVNDGGVLGLIKEFSFLYRGLAGTTIRALAQKRPTLIHAHFGIDSCRAIKVASSLQVPLISTFHGYDATQKDFGLRRTRDGRFYLKNRLELQRRGVHFVAVSEFIRKKLLEKGFPPERTSVQYIGVDVNEFSFWTSRNPAARVLFVGRLVEQKGCSLLIQAVGRIQAKIPDVELVVIGDGPERLALEKQAATHLRHYRFLGAQPSHVVRQHMRDAAVLSVPSISVDAGDCEGFGMVFVEAQATGVPVVSFSNGGIPEAVVHGETGFLAPTGDWRQLASYIAMLLSEESLHHKFSLAARRHVETNFDLDKQTFKLEDLYCRVVEQSLM